MKENKNNILTDKEKEEYQKLRGLEKFGKLVGKELSEENKEKLKIYRKRLGELLGEDLEDNREIPQELKKYRESWEKNIHLNDQEEFKNKIIRAAKNLPVKMEIEKDGSRIIEFKLGNKKYKILDVINIVAHTDDDYKIVNRNNLIEKEQVLLGGMMGDDVEKWENQKLKEYVKEKEREGLHIPKKEEVRGLLDELGEIANLDKEREQVAMLMYLTGMHGDYWLNMNSSRENRRNVLSCNFIGFKCTHSYERDDPIWGEPGGSMCMIATED